MNQSKLEDKTTVEGGIENDEKSQQKHNSKTELDVAFVLDCTGSMNPYIQSCKDNIISISSQINNECENCDVQFALISYRDIPPQESTFITKIFNFTPIPFRIQIELQKLTATGGGDTPEALTSALYDCYTNLNWRKESIKIIIVITDAPPHGLEKNINDGFPDGDIDTFNDNQNEGKDDSSKKHLNIIEIIQCIRTNLKASIYSVACEPGLSCNTDFANDFMQYIAQYTNGKFLPLSSATLLPDVIVGSVKQQINLNNLTYKLDEEIEKIKAKHGNDISSNEINKIIMEKWKNEGIKKKEISIGTLYRNKRSKYNINLLMNEQKIKSLKDFKTNCKIFPRLKESDFRHLNVDKYKNSKKKISTKTTHKMKLINTKMKLLQQIWDKYIDPYCNGDVDMEEWCLGMNKLNVKLSEIQQRKVFNCLDNEESGFIDKDDFIQFLESKYENIELIQYQKRILDAIRKQNIHINNIIEKDEIITKQPEKTIVIDALNIKLNSNIRPTISDLGNCGLIPQNWLLDLYGLSDTIRKKHSRMESAVQDLKSCLNVPSILTDVVARDVVDEIECVYPYLESNNNNNNDTDWGAYDLELLEREMVSSMNAMAYTMMDELKEEELFHNEIDKRKKENVELFELKYAKKWSEYEVANWLGLIGMEMYATYFCKEGVDGMMLLEDINEEMLMCNLGVKKIHAKKIMREICNLKTIIGKEVEIGKDEEMDNMKRERSLSLSRSCSAQRVYSREASLDIGDMEDVMNRLNIIKSEYK